MRNSYNWNSLDWYSGGETQVKQMCNMKDSEELLQQVLHNVTPNYMYQFMLLYWQLAELYPTKSVPFDNFSTHNLIKFEYLELRLSKICTCTKSYFSPKELVKKNLCSLFYPVHM